MEIPDHSKPTFSILLTVFLRTFLATFIGALLCLVLIKFSGTVYLSLEVIGIGGWFAPVLLLLCLIGPGAWYINFAKKQYGSHWSIGVTGILTVTVVSIWFYFLIGPSFYG